MSAQFAQVIPRQVGENLEEAPQYTGSPRQLFVYDIKLFFRNILYLPLMFFPLAPWPSGPLDEQYPSLKNIFDISLHLILFVVQLAFLISLPILIYLPVSLFVSYIVGVLFLNYLVCQLLNRGIPEDGLKSTEDEYTQEWERHDDERWIFLNGICVGKNWLQNNIDRLSRTFHRPIVGVHNKTSGVIFDIIQCLIQRSLLFATPDVRECYILVKKALYQPGVKRVILILHSQGGIEGGMIVDWLLNEVPQDLLQYLEIYTFGIIANHFNNPYRDVFHSKGAMQNGEHRRRHNRAISHIEHYANSDDFASRFGVLHFTKLAAVHPLKNRFMGKVFINPRSGHQLNQHYLDSMFPLDETRRFAREPEEGDFMDLKVFIEGQSVRGEPLRHYENYMVSARGKGGLRISTGEKGDEAEVSNLSPVLPEESRGWKDDVGFSRALAPCQLRTRDVSRLWQYRNGGRPM
ncbi:unnamed protein product [Penicillium salamii]|uniref:Uncharacterized protein n=1 Tax=Penicillium salamii TaxID=1612424 RepID=A0A9W4J0E7_9EURO|nr:unnamed protein product [Penicillium salamii]CAG8362831.1 unnamed protein product [Penicillium salamii]CAG8365895.1 unnamed protein product [Penicillium salamii]CAG8385835.1 unnamed protein product [Penicillium salamii]